MFLSVIADNFSLAPSLIVGSSVCNLYMYVYIYCTYNVQLLGFYFCMTSTEIAQRMEVLVLVGLLCLGLVLLAKIASRHRKRGMARSVDSVRPSLQPGGVVRGQKDGLWTAVGQPERSHPLYKRLSSICGRVNAMSPGEVKQRLRELRLEHK